MKVRRFLLENEKGQQFRLDDLNEGCFLVSPTNLGYSYETDFVRLGYNFIENNRKIQQKNPNGTAYFKSYDKVKEFIDYIESSSELKWIYIVPYKAGEKIYYRDVVIVKLDKTEKSGKWLACPVEFAGLSLWYEENTVIYTIEQLTNEIRWDFRWDSSFTDYDSRNLQYINQGHVEAPIYVEMDGHLVNPKIELYVEGELYQTVEVTTEIAEYEKFLYDTRENQFFIGKQNTDGTKTKLFSLDYIDFYNDNVIRLPKNKSCEIKLTADNEVLNARLTIYPRYKAV